MQGLVRSVIREESCWHAANPVVIKNILFQTFKLFSAMKKTLFTLVLFLLGMGSYAQSKDADEIAIKKVLEAETSAVHNKDFEKWINCFAKSSDVAFGFSPLLPTYMVRNYDNLASFGRDYFPKSPVPSAQVAEFTDYQMKINGNSAFVTCVQINTEPDGSKARFHKADYLEKINGEWKMVGHFFGQEPKPDQQVKN